MLHSPDIQIILRKENAGIKSAGMDTQPHPTQSDPFYRAVAPLLACQLGLFGAVTVVS